MREATINVGICLDERMLNAALVLLASVKAHAKPERPIKIFALTNFSTGVLQVAASEMNDDTFELVSIRVDNVPGIPVRGQITDANYLRFLLPAQLPDLSKIIYIDSDTVVHHDLAPLYDVDLKGHTLAAVPDYGMLLGTQTWPDFTVTFEGRELPFPAYAKDVLKLDCLEQSKYFNSGVMVLDLDRWRATNLTERAIECLRVNPGLYFPDQDALNMLLRGDYLALDARWNAFANCAYPAFYNALSFMNRPGRDWEQLRGRWRRDPWIVHYAGANKPWVPSDPKTAKDGLWWRYAIQSPLHARIINDYRAEERLTRPPLGKRMHLPPGKGTPFTKRESANEIADAIFPNEGAAFATARRASRHLGKS